jgi:pyruvate formate lyase activating enzyme
MGRCLVCNKESIFISNFLKVCLICIRENFSEAKPYIEEAHRKSRKEFNLPIGVAKDKEGIFCNLCINNCGIAEGKTSFCGLRKNLEGKLFGPDKEKANLEFYFDSLPTNCVADFVCPAGTGCGWPEFSYSKGSEYGYKNLAVFYNGCSFNCLFCQNWHYRNNLEKKRLISTEELVKVIDEKTSCICYFGGDPSCQLPHSILTSKIALKNKKNRILRICWETNGSMNEDLLEEIITISLESGGCIKFDLKTWTEELNLALCGVTNRRTLENFKKVSGYIKERPKVPLLVASTLLIPGYIDEYEIKKISEFIVSLDKNIPYALLAFYPCFYMEDLPVTSKEEAYKYKEIALKTGLRNVSIGNIHLLR